VKLPNNRVLSGKLELIKDNLKGLKSCKQVSGLINQREAVNRLNDIQKRTNPQAFESEVDKINQARE